MVEWGVLDNEGKGELELSRISRIIRSEIIIVIIAVIVLGALLFMKPLIGVADNGDFSRIMIAGGIQYSDSNESYQDRYFGYAHTSYSYGPIGLGGYVSSQLLIVFLAGIIGRVLNSQLFDIRVLSFLYTILLLTALYFIVKFNKRSSIIFNMALIISLSLVFLDVGYAAYFNSFFGEAITLIFMLLTFGLALAIIRSNNATRWLLTAFYLSSLCLIATKLQNAPIGLIIIVLGLRMWSVRSDRPWRRSILIWSAILLLATVVMYVGAPRELKQINLYQTVFFGILKDSPDPARDLSELGLPEEFKVNAGTNYFQKDTVLKQNDPRIVEALGKLSHKDVLLYYAKHPQRFIDKLERAADNGMSIRPYYLGSYDQSEGNKYGAVSYTYSTWSEFKNKHMPRKLWFVASLFAAYVLVLAVHYWRSRSLRERMNLEALLAIALVGMFGFAIPLLGDGEADLGKHLFLFNVCFDMMLVTSVLYIVWHLIRLVSGRR